MRKILIFAGSARRDAYSRQLAAAATAFTEDGQLADTDAGDGLARLVRRLIAAGRLFAR